MRFFSKVDTILMAVVFWILFIVVGLQFFTRYVLNDSLGWTEEIARMLLIVLTYIGAIVCARTDQHIRVDFIAGFMSIRFQRYHRLTIDLIASGLFIFLAWTAAVFATKTSLEMSSIEVSKSVIFWICSGSLFLMAIHYFLHFLTQLKSPVVSDDTHDLGD